ncbi:hypothetical protein HM1_0365 [Heliomicrobium modesticaldum Ice1]|uniref:Uncharacterized protein n=1 Tax=Heliobacterium modesticaldum (strain ATCC 51547 / Ice1) TaxID=498761 RepID=B0TF02_HELMI|nr:hypothetical protein HM1_0365 [Heliomicrobium modesticaldum Ice1]
MTGPSGAPKKEVYPENRDKPLFLMTLAFYFMTVKSSERLLPFLQGWAKEYVATPASTP